jgi:hypothetical protein
VRRSAVEVTRGVNQSGGEPGRVRFDAGTRVEVRTGFERTWARGFEIVAANDAGYTVRRLSDGRELPVVFDDDRVRRERRDDNLWWL